MTPALPTARDAHVHRARDGAWRRHALRACCPPALASTAPEESRSAISSTGRRVRTSSDAVTVVPAAGDGEDVVIGRAGDARRGGAEVHGVAGRTPSLGSKPSSLQGGGGAQSPEVWKFGTARLVMRRSRPQSTGAAGDAGRQARQAGQARQVPRVRPARRDHPRPECPRGPGDRGRFQDQRALAARHSEVSSTMRNVDRRVGRAVLRDAIAGMHDGGVVAAHRVAGARADHERAGRSERARPCPCSPPA